MAFFFVTTFGFNNLLIFILTYSLLLFSITILILCFLYQKFFIKYLMILKKSLKKQFTKKFNRI